MWLLPLSPHDLDQCELFRSSCEPSNQLWLCGWKLDEPSEEPFCNSEVLSKAATELLFNSTKSFLNWFSMFNTKDQPKRSYTQPIFVAKKVWNMYTQPIDSWSLSTSRLKSTTLIDLNRIKSVIMYRQPLSPFSTTGKPTKAYQINVHHIPYAIKYKINR